MTRKTSRSAASIGSRPVSTEVNQTVSRFMGRELTMPQMRGEYSQLSIAMATRGPARIERKARMRPDSRIVRLRLLAYSAGALKLSGGALPSSTGPTRISRASQSAHSGQKRRSRCRL